MRAAVTESAVEQLEAEAQRREVPKEDVRYHTRWCRVDDLAKANRGQPGHTLFVDETNGWFAGATVVSSGYPATLPTRSASQSAMLSGYPISWVGHSAFLSSNPPSCRSW